jgi:catechol 2,3-dioxygenase-like lactoylglutathione lyase family enzyme
MKYNHLGVPTTDEHEWAGYLEGGKVHYSDPPKDPYCVEWLKFNTDSPMPKELQQQIHIAFQVDDLDAEIAGKKIILEPFSPFEGRRCAFILHHGLLVELMQDT